MTFIAVMDVFAASAPAGYLAGRLCIKAAFRRRICHRSSESSIMESDGEGVRV